MKILIIDDEPTFLEALAHYLAEQGHLIETATNGQQGWNIYSEISDLDVILTDIKMPLLNGLHLLKQIRANEDDIPVIMMTGYAELPMSIEALRLDAFDFLVKPFEFQSLEITLSKLASRQVSQQELREMFPLSNGHLQMAIPSRSEFIPSALSCFQEMLTSLCRVYHLNYQKLRLCLHEASTNAIIHGNLEMDSSLKEHSFEAFDTLLKERQSSPEFFQRQVTVLCRFSAERIEFEIADEGAGFDPSQLPDFEDPMRLKMISGRGLLLIQSFMDAVTWNASGNRITMVKFLQPEVLKR